MVSTRQPFSSSSQTTSSLDKAAVGLHHHTPTTRTSCVKLQQLSSSLQHHDPPASSLAAVRPEHARFFAHQQVPALSNRLKVKVCAQSGSAAEKQRIFQEAAQALVALSLQMQRQPPPPPAGGAEVQISDLVFHPPGCEAPLLDKVNLSIPANKLGLIIGRSGSGKTTLLQLLSGLSEQNSGSVVFRRGGLAVGSATGTTMDERMRLVGLVFQFPERHFLGSDIAQELMFGWPPTFAERMELSNRVERVLRAVGLDGIPLTVPPHALSGGQQRRLALAIQLVRQPSLLLLDEPLAGLDWQSRQEVVGLLSKLKKECTLLVVSHDLKEIAPLVDCAWRMKLGGSCEPVQWPPADLDILDQ